MSRAALVAVAQHSRARGPALLVAFRLADHTNSAGWAWPSVPTLADETGYSRDTVLRGLAVLEVDVAELFVERARNRRGNRYRLRLPGVPGSAIEEAPDAIGTVAHSDHSTGENGRNTPVEQSQIRVGTVAQSDPNHRNRKNLAAPPRVGDTVDLDRSCPTCRGSTHVFDDARAAAVPCPTCRPSPRTPPQETRP